MSAICPEQHFGYLVKDVSTLWREIIDRRLEPLGLSAARWQPLVVLYRADGPLTQSMLATALEIEAPTLVRLLDRLNRDGWIERRQCPQDRRAHHVVLTPRALEACAEIEEVLAQIRSQILGAAKKTEVRACIDVLERIRARALDLRHDGAPPPESPLTQMTRRPRRPA
jgi:MarR family transcriptional regulator for hemolysin